MNIDLETGELDLRDIRYIAPTVDVPGSKMTEVGTLLICTASGSKKHLGKTALIDQPMDFAFGGFMGLLVPSRSILPKYLHWAMRSNKYWDFIEQLSSGTNINNLKFSQLSAFPIPLPPLDEQKRIVAVLDEAFEGLDRARANAEANLVDIEALEESGLAGYFSVKEMSDSLPITEVCDFQGGTQPPKSKFVSEDRPGYVRLLQIRDFKSDDKAVFIPDRRGLKKCSAEDVMIGRYGASVGQILRGKAGAYNVALVRTIPDECRVSKEFLFHFLRSNLFQKPLLEKSSRGAQDGFNKGDLAQIKIPILPLGRQDEICSQLGALNENLQAVGRQISQSKRELDTLRQSLLQKAFSGELT